MSVLQWRGAMRIGQGYPGDGRLGSVIVVTEHAAGEEFLEAASNLLEVLAGTPGFSSGQIGRSPDDPGVWLMVTVWENVGSMRRAFGTYDAKVAAAPVMVSAANRPSAFEVLVEAVDGSLEVRQPDRS